jgi:hypothetical protein
MNIINRITTSVLTQQKMLSSRFNSIGLNISNHFLFSKFKKSKPEIKTPSIHIGKYNEKLEGFVIYENEEGNRIKGISLAFLICFLSGFWAYTKANDD